jgi:RimJ/RimL family protein N-acetyltransferase
MKNTENTNKWVAEGDKIKLRPITYDDTDYIVKWRNNERVRNNFIYREKFTPESHNNFVRTKVETGEVVQLIICEKETERPIGSVYFRDVDMAKKEAEYGIFIGEDDAIGKGYGNETATLALRYAADVIGLRNVILRVFNDNTAARKSYEHAGFVFKEDMPQVECSDGTKRDMILMYAQL